MSYKTRRLDDGWVVVMDGKREVIRVQLPKDGMTKAELKAFERHLIANLNGAN